MKRSYCHYTAQMIGSLTSHVRRLQRLHFLVASAVVDGDLPNQRRRITRQFSQVLGSPAAVLRSKEDQKGVEVVCSNIKHWSSSPSPLAWLGLTWPAPLTFSHAATSFPLGDTTTAVMACIHTADHQRWRQRARQPLRDAIRPQGE